MEKVQKSLSSFAQKTYEDGYSPRHGMQIMLSDTRLLNNLTKQSINSQTEVILGVRKSLVS